MNKNVHNCVTMWLIIFFCLIWNCFSLFLLIDPFIDIHLLFIQCKMRSCTQKNVLTHTFRLSVYSVVMQYVLNINLQKLSSYLFPKNVNDAMRANVPFSCCSVRAYTSCQFFFQFFLAILLLLSFSSRFVNFNFFCGRMMQPRVWRKTHDKTWKKCEPFCYHTPLFGVFLRFIFAIWFAVANDEVIQ